MCPSGSSAKEKERAGAGKERAEKEIVLIPNTTEKKNNSKLLGKGDDEGRAL